MGLGKLPTEPPQKRALKEAVSNMAESGRKASRFSLVLVMTTNSVARDPLAIRKQGDEAQDRSAPGSCVRHIGRRYM
jgi:hypothetical protein